MAIAKIILNGVVQMDVTQDTVAANNLLSGETATGADGNPVTGAYVPSGGGLVYETGTFTPTEDIVRPTITFSNTHTEPPMFAMVSDTTGVYDDTANTIYEYVYADWYRFAGYGAYASSTSQNFGLSFARQRTTSTTAFASSSSLFTNNSDVSTDSPNSYPRYYVSETYLKPQGSSTVYFRVGHTYKWIAVWKPTT